MYNCDTHGLRELVVCFPRPGVVRAKNRYDRGAYPFAVMASEHRLDNFKPDTEGD
jgi:hypothetical protein